MPVGISTTSLNQEVGLAGFKLNPFPKWKMRPKMVYEDAMLQIAWQQQLCSNTAGAAFAKDCTRPRNATRPQLRQRRGWHLQIHRHNSIPFRVLIINYQTFDAQEMALIDIKVYWDAICPWVRPHPVTETSHH